MRTERSTVNGNVRQRVFDAMAKEPRVDATGEGGTYRTAPEWSRRCAGVAPESCRAALKWLRDLGLAERQRVGRNTLYALKHDAVCPPDGRIRNGGKRRDG